MKVCVPVSRSNSRAFKIQTASTPVLSTLPAVGSSRLTEAKPPGRTFPDPITPSTAQSHYSAYLSQDDYADLRLFRNIYFLRNTKTMGVDQLKRIDDFFPFCKFGHIGYRYEQLSVIGKGTFGIVIKCLDHKTRKQVACKLVKDTTQEHKQIQLEIEFNKILSSDEKIGNENNILYFFDTFTFRGYVCMVSELGECDLYSLLKKRKFLGFNISDIKRYLREIAKGLAYIHSCNIVHSDMKPENVLVMDNKYKTLKITDFGCSCFDKDPLYKTVQSMYYRAPEVVFGFQYCREIDVWSFGCMAFELATGSALFEANDEKTLIRKYTEIIGEPPAEMVRLSRKMQGVYSGRVVNRLAANERRHKILSIQLDRIHPALTNIVDSCLEWLPSKRITMQQLLELPFFN